MLKLNRNDLNKLQIAYDKDKNPVSNQYAVFDSLRFSHSDCGSSPVKTSNKWT